MRQLEFALARIRDAVSALTASFDVVDAGLAAATDDAPGTLPAALQLAQLKESFSSSESAANGVATLVEELVRAEQAVFATPVVTGRLAPSLLQLSSLLRRTAPVVPSATLLARVLATPTAEAAPTVTSSDGGSVDVSDGARDGPMLPPSDDSTVEGGADKDKDKGKAEYAMVSVCACVRVSVYVYVYVCECVSVSVCVCVRVCV